MARLIGLGEGVPAPKGKSETAPVEMVGHLSKESLVDAFEQDDPGAFIKMVMGEKENQLLDAELCSFMRGYFAQFPSSNEESREDDERPQFMQEDAIGFEERIGGMAGAFRLFDVYPKTREYINDLLASLEEQGVERTSWS